MAFFADDQLISTFPANDRKKPAARKGWSASRTSGCPDMDIYRVWGNPTRHLHHLKANTTDYFFGDEHIAHVRWRVIEHVVTIKKPPADYERPVDHTKMETARRMRAEAARMRAAREAEKAA